MLLKSRQRSHVPHVGNSEYLKQVPDKLESMIGDKRFLQASHVLMRSLKTANKEDMKDVGALTDLRTYLTDQRQVSKTSAVCGVVLTREIAGPRRCPD